MSALPPKADISFYEHTDFRPSLISIASATKRPDNPLFFRTSRPPIADIAERDRDVRFSNRPVGVKRFQAIDYCGSQHHSRARASLRNRHIGRSIMGSEDEVEQSLWRPCRRQVQADMRTHLIHRPARDIIPPLGGARVSSCDPERPLRHSFSGPSEFSAINPDAMHNHRQPSR